MKNHYEALGLSQTSTQEEIKKAYRKLAKMYHPDAKPDNKAAEQKFKSINDAYTVLSDETKKADYDRRMYGADAGARPEGDVAGKDRQVYSGRKNMSAEEFSDASKAFESFFGFDPHGSSGELKKGNGKVKPMKTKDAFEAIFSKKNF